MTKKTWDDLTQKRLWLVGRYRGPEVPAEGPPDQLAPWEFMGIFSAREKAIAACTDRLDFVASVDLDKREPEETLSFADIVYPAIEAERS